jgi:hypothetical protein
VSAAPKLTDVATLRSQARKHIERGAVTAGYGADREQVLKLLNEALATEIVCVLRYRRHHFMARGIHGQSVGAEFLTHSIEEQGHADLLAARIGQWTSGILILLSLVWFQLMGVVFGGLLFLINTAQRMQAYLMMVNGQGFPSGAGGNGPFPHSPWNQGPWSGPPGSEPDWEPRAGGGHGDTVDAIEVREIPSQSPNRLQ